MAVKYKMKKTPGDIVFTVINYIILTAVLLAVLYPLWFILIASFSAGSPNASQPIGSDSRDLRESPL